MFERHYTSLDGWRRPSPWVDHDSNSATPLLRGADTRLAPGWYHTFDERLFAADARSDAAAPTTGLADMEVVHRMTNGRGRGFYCASPHDPSTSFDCIPDDGTVDVLQWDAAESLWRVLDGTGVATLFEPSGRLVSKHDPAGAGWSVTYHTSGDEAGLIHYVEDQYTRRLNFVWEVQPNVPSTLIRLEDSALATLATFEYSGFLGFLTRATSAAGDESYSYLTEYAAGDEYTRPYITEIIRDGAPVTTVGYEKPWSALAGAYRYTGRVGSVVAADGSFEFRYRNAVDNLCYDAFGYDEARSTMVVDRSAAATSGANTCGVDGDCASGHACDESGACRPFTCQEYVTPTGGSGPNFSTLGSLSGNCACSGGSTRAWIQTAGGGTRMTSSTSRDGDVTTFSYDAQGRMVERCEGDSDTDGDPSTCAASAVWTAFQYDTTWPSRVKLEQRRSRLTTGTAETEYEYDTITGRLLSTTQRGYTRGLSDSLVGPIEEVTEYQYDTLGRLQEVSGPATERVVYIYWPAGSGTASGMLRYEDRYVDTSTKLRTTYTAYTTTGTPGSVMEPSGVVREFGYAFGGMRVMSAKVNGQETHFDYDSAGRLWRIAEPTGRRIQYTYDALGRVQLNDIFDAGYTGVSDQIAFSYDTGGRRTSLVAQRVSSSGAPISTAFTWSATYDEHGFRSSETKGPQLPVTYTYDAQAMGYLTSLTRGDGDVEHFESDGLGRHTEITRTFATSVSGTHEMSYSNATGSAVDVGDELPTRVVEPNGQVRDYVYDDFGHLVRSESAEWGTLRWRWIDGRMTEALGADNRRTEYHYDGMSRVTFIDHDADNPALLGQDYAFDYDNADGAITCPTGPTCTYREGRLARVQIEYNPGWFWHMYYDYAADGQVNAERWPDGRESGYEYTNGLITRTALPARPGDALRFEYDTSNSDGHDPTELRRIVGERGSDIVNWASSMQHDALGRLAQVTQHDLSGNPTAITRRNDGRLACWWIYRRGPTTAVPVVDRCYAYSDDGSAWMHDSLASGDSPRTFFHDGGNRLTCSTSALSSSSCPSGSPLLERYEYDEGDNRTSLETPAGVTNYALYGNTLHDEYPPGRKIWYAYQQGPGGPRQMDMEVTSGAPTNIRNYSYDGDGRLSVVTLARPTASPSSKRDDHTLTILYDHRARPLMTVDVNHASGVEARWQYYYDLQDRLINQVYTADVASSVNYVVSTYVHIEPVLLGVNRAEYVSGSVASEQFGYYAMAPEGLPAAAYQFNPNTLATTESWRAQWAPFGSRLSETGDVNKWRPPFRFHGQIHLPRSDASWWNGSVLFTSREELVLNRWRAFDPRVGQYLQPEPVLADGSAVRPHPFAYAGLAPVDNLDPDGRDVTDYIEWYCATVGAHHPFCIGYNARRIQECVGPGALPRNPPDPEASSCGDPECAAIGDLAACRYCCEVRHVFAGSCKRDCCLENPHDGPYR